MEGKRGRGRGAVLREVESSDFFEENKERPSSSSPFQSLAFTEPEPEPQSPLAIQVSPEEEDPIISVFRQINLQNKRKNRQQALKRSRDEKESPSSSYSPSLRSEFSSFNSSPSLNVSSQQFESVSPSTSSGFCSANEEREILSEVIKGKIPFSPSTSSVSGVSSSSAIDEKSQSLSDPYKGIKGEILPIIINYIRLSIKENCGIFEYNCDFEPPIDSTRIKRNIFYDHEFDLGTARTFDGSKLYLPFLLPDKITEYESLHPHDKNQKVLLRITFVKENFLKDCIHFYNVLFRRIQRTLGMVEMKRNHFDFRGVFEIPKHRLEIWPGFVTNIGEYKGGLFLCLDNTFRVLRQITVLDILEEFKNCTNDEDAYKKKFTDYILNKIVLTRYNNRNHRIDDIAWFLNPNCTFNQRGKEVSYKEYYKNQYNIDIEESEQPLLISRPKLKAFEKVSKLICLIPELCFITGLSQEISSDYRIMKDINAFTRITPEQRQFTLRKFIQNINENEECMRILESWGIMIEEASLSQMDARVIKAPVISINDRLELRHKPDFSTCDFNSLLSRNKCFEPIEVKSWLVISPDKERQKAIKFIQTYKIVAPLLGISAGNGEFISAKRGTEIDFRKALFENLNDNIQFVVIILPSLNSNLYGMLKRIMSIERPVSCQMIRAQTLSNERRIRSVVQKVALQINCKLGGAIWSLKIPMVERIMFVGVDVYHDPGRKSQSCTALIASMNSEMTRYYSRVVFQKPQQEIIDSMKMIFTDALKEFYKDNSACWPDRVIVFRDGVGDGQLELTKNHEVVQLLDAFKGLSRSTPKFTFVVVQKRINTRILTKELNNQKYKNPPPGTVLDHTVTRKYLFDFFLVSQILTQGTVNPTHYIVLADNSKISPDLIQKFAYASSFMYFNWAGSIRVPAVCQYAHKLAYLSGEFLKSEPNYKLRKKLFYI